MSGRTNYTDEAAVTERKAKWNAWICCWTRNLGVLPYVAGFEEGDIQRRAPPIHLNRYIDFAYEV